jgi:hypothetical protein
VTGEDEHAEDVTDAKLLRERDLGGWLSGPVLEQHQSAGASVAGKDREVDTAGYGPGPREDWVAAPEGEPGVLVRRVEVDMSGL